MTSPKLHGVPAVVLDLTRPPTSTVDRRSPDERCMSSFPSKLTEFEVGWRLDALDRQGGWFAGTVVEVRNAMFVGVYLI